MFTVDDISIRCVERKHLFKGELIYRLGMKQHFHTDAQTPQSPSCVTTSGPYQRTYY